MIYSTKHIYYKIVMPDGKMGVGVRHGIFNPVVKAMVGDKIIDITREMNVKLYLLGMDKISD